MEDQGTVLVVDDESAVRELYATYLSEEYAVRTAASGRDALEQIDESVDVVLLDRRMPGMAGDEVLAEIRERGYDCRVAMVTAVEPTVDIVDMGFDDYVTKPVRVDELVSCVESLVARNEYDDLVQEYYAVASKLATLEERKPRNQLAGEEGIQELRDRLAELEDRTDEAVDTVLEDGAAEALFRGL